MYSFSSRHERRLLWLLALTQFTIIMDFMVMMPLGPQLMQSFHISPASFATAISAYSWCSGLSGLFAATYIDRFDRRRLLLVAYALFAISNLACALAPGFSTLLVARAFAGITSGVLGSVIMAIVSDVIPAQRRGAATGTIMTAFSLASVAGVPAGIVLGAHFGWAAPFILLTLMSALIWVGGAQLVPSLTSHMLKKPPAMNTVLPALWRLATARQHMKAFVLTFVMMGSQMLVIPFVSPMLVANHGIAMAQLSWLYMAGGAATFFTARLAGRLADRFGSKRVFALFGVISVFPVLFLTHLPDLPFPAMIFFFMCFMIVVSARMVPMQALLTTVPAPAHRGAFLSMNSALQAFGSGCGAWLGGLILTKTTDNHIENYGVSGWLAVTLVLFAVFLSTRIRSAAIAAAPAAVPEPVPVAP
jgi:DHA1 family inner membrane transport protein